MPASPHLTATLRTLDEKMFTRKLRNNTCDTWSLIQRLRVQRMNAHLIVKFASLETSTLSITPTTTTLRLPPTDAVPRTTLPESQPQLAPRPQPDHIPHPPPTPRPPPIRVNRSMLARLPVGIAPTNPSRLHHPRRWQPTTPTPHNSPRIELLPQTPNSHLLALAYHAPLPPETRAPSPTPPPPPAPPPHPPRQHGATPPAPAHNTPSPTQIHPPARPHHPDATTTLCTLLATTPTTLPDATQSSLAPPHAAPPPVQKRASTRSQPVRQAQPARHRTHQNQTLQNDLQPVRAACTQPPPPRDHTNSTMA
jgi:hypothetical protein